MRRRLLAAAGTAGDVAALGVLGLVWLLTGAWRTVPRHDDAACWDCQHGISHDPSAVVL